MRHRNRVTPWATPSVASPARSARALLILNNLSAALDRVPPGSAPELDAAGGLAVELLDGADQAQAAHVPALAHPGVDGPG